MVIFIYWNHGIEAAPPLVRTCIQSWRQRNPDRAIHVLDDSTLSQWIDMDDVRQRNPRLTIQAFADILRWRLLARYGGVWVDATLYCNRPLSEWLPKCQAPKGFFAFRTPEAHLYHSWFLVGQPDNPVVQAMSDEIERFFVHYGGYRHYWELRGLWRIFHAIEKRAGRHNQWIWRSHVFRRYIKAAPYFWVMYLMGAAMKRSDAAQDEFLKVRQDYGECPHALQNMTQPGKAPQLAKVQSLLDGPCPVQKLTTKRFVPEWAEAGILELLDHHARR